MIRMSQGLELRLLGLPEVTVDGVACRLPTRKALALVAVLALEGRGARSTLAGWLWSEHGPEGARKNLRQELHRLSETRLGEYLIVGREEICLHGVFETDVARFRAQVARGALGAALETFRGPLLEGFELRGASGFEDWLGVARDALDQERIGVLERQAAVLEAQGDLRAAVRLHRDLLEADPLQERYHRETIRLHTALGERAEALAQFERCKAMLREEFGLEPLAETELEAERARVWGLSPPGVTSDPSYLKGVPNAFLTPSLAPPLVGRVEAWTQLERILAAKKSVVVSGEAGVGKSRLVSEFAAARGRYHLIRGQPFDAGVPFATLSRALRELLVLEPELPLSGGARRELARLVPDLSAEVAAPLTSGAARLRLFDAYVEFLTALAGRGGLLVQEDLHDFDASSFELSCYATSQLRAQGLKLPSLLTVRLDALEPTAALQLEALIRAGQLEKVELGPLAEHQVAELVERLSGRRAALFPRRLRQATGGNPFFVLETLRALFEGGELHVLPEGGWATPYDEQTSDYRELPLPRSVREAVLARVRRLGEAAGRVLDVGSLSGEPLDLGALAEASALGGWEALEACEKAVASGLLREGEGGYRFAHDLVRRALDGHLGDARRRLIHRQLAAGLEAAQGPPARIAHHRIGGGQALEAAHWWRRAAEVALESYAGREALTHLERALEVLPQDAPQRFEVLARFVRVGYELGGRGRIREHLETLERLAVGPAQRAFTAHQQAIVLGQGGHDERVIEAYTRARDLYGQAGDAQGRCRANTNLAITAFEMGQFARADAYVQASLVLAAPLGPDRLGLALMWHGVILGVRAEPEAALARHLEAQEVLRDASSPFSRLQAHHGHAGTLLLYGVFGEALAAADRALEGARRLESQMMEAYGLASRAAALRGLGRRLGRGGESELASALDTARAHLGERSFLVSCLLELARFGLDRGEPQAALEATEEVLSLLPASSYSGERAVALALRSQVRLALGQRNGALEDSTEAVHLLQGLEGLREAQPATLHLAHLRALRANGQEEEARALLERVRFEVLERASRMGDPELRAHFLALEPHRALLEQGGA